MTVAPGPWRHGGGCGLEGMGEGLSRIRRERRPQELRTAGAPSDPWRLATARKPGGHTGEAAPLINRRPPVSSRAHGCRAACRRDGAGTRPRGTQVIILRRATPRLHLVSNRTDGLHGGLHLRSEGVAHEPGGVPPGLICGPWDRCFDGRHPVCDRLSTPRVMLMKEPFEGRWPHLRERLDRRPMAQHIATSRVRMSSHPWKTCGQSAFNKAVIRWLSRVRSWTRRRLYSTR